jgi:hypothetical protein
MWVCKAWAKKTLEFLHPGTIIDLGSGEDARIGVAIRERYGAHLIPVDTHPPPQIEPADFLIMDPMTLPGIRMDVSILWVSNPPFSKAQEFLEKTLRNLDRSPHGSVVAFLLRLGFLGSRKRAPFWRRYPPDHITVLGTDSEEYGIFWWVSQPTLIRGPAISIAERPESEPTWP